ncbi:hypothetical protein [Glycomyces rhizosphaerae]|uniref:Bacterial Pleckstrin homology domain-containing protein n=1 Tax=Glycomyces rhizosphaerae TaxID=2054422 RepID=A0ABV7Q6Q5_9ACTN
MPSSHASRHLEIRFARRWSVVMCAMGVVLLICAALSLLMPFVPTMGPFALAGLAFLAGGLRSLCKPRYRYDTETRALTVYMAVGPGTKGIGAPKGERVYFDGKRIMRELPDGSRRRVSTVGANKDDLALLIAALPQG